MPFPHQKTIDNETKTVLFGAGIYGKIFLEKLMHNGIAPSYFVDKNFFEKMSCI